MKGLFAGALGIVALGLGISSLTIARASAPWNRTEPFPVRRSDTPLQTDSIAGRFLYLGDAPRFEPEDLELWVSKLGLTLRVKAWVPETLPEDYLQILMARWKKIHDAFQSPTMSFVPMQSARDIARRSRSRADRAWSRIAGQYLHSGLEGFGEKIYAKSEDRETYRDTILTATLRSYLNDPAATIEQGLDLSAELTSDPANERLRERSVELFEKHLGPIFTRDGSRPGHIGFLTFVYPIAATTAGPFRHPSEGLRKVGLPGTVEARWWSDRWGDEFGGFPFLLIDWNGVAFHGPITVKPGLDVVFLRRGFVSHGCHRMDPSDILELRTILPDDYSRLVSLGRGIPEATLEWPDVTDLDGDGQLEAIDVAYYDIPIEVPISRNQSIESATAPYRLPRAQLRWWREHYSRYDGVHAGKNRFDLSSATFYGIPKYEIVGNSLVRTGEVDGVKVRTFARRKGMIIQYREAGVHLSGYDDDAGQYPPEYFY